MYVASSYPRSRCLIRTCRCTLPGTSNERAARTNNGTPPRAVTHSSNGSGSISK